MILSDIKNKKVLIINDGRGISNYGLDLSSKALIELFELSGNCVDSISSMDFHRMVSTSFQSLGKRIAKKLLPSVHFAERIPDSLDQYPSSFAAWSAHPNRSEKRLLNRLSRCDVVIYNAEGSTHSNNISSKKGLFLLYLAAKIGKKSFFMNGSVTLQRECTDKIAPVLAYVAEHIDMVYLREHLSYRNVCEIVGASNCAYLPDSIFKLYEIADSGMNATLDGRGYFLVSSSMSKPVGAFAPDMLPLGKLVDSLALKFGYPIFLIKDPEDVYLAKFAKSRGYKIFSGDNVEQMFSLFNNASFLLSGRFHHLILAIINGCPVIAMDTTSSKNRGIIGMLPQLEYSSHLINPSNVLASSEFIHEQATLISKPNVRAGAKAALTEFSRSQYNLLMTGFDL